MALANAPSAEKYKEPCLRKVAHARTVLVAPPLSWNLVNTDVLSDVPVYFVVAVVPVERIVVEEIEKMTSVIHSVFCVRTDAIPM